jgi:hypothetical protein
MQKYASELSMPLLGLSAPDVIDVVRSSLADDECVVSVTPKPQLRGAFEPVEQHASVMVRFAAASESEAQAIAKELHDRALQSVLASLPPDSPEQGWMSAFGLPELSPD